MLAKARLHTQLPQLSLRCTFCRLSRLVRIYASNRRTGLGQENRVLGTTTEDEELRWQQQQQLINAIEFSGSPRALPPSHRAVLESEQRLHDLPLSPQSVHPR
jgi:hypothetical protein